MIKGQCLCGEIEFTADELPGMVFNCHCHRCQKSHGAAYSTQVLCRPETLQLQKGKGQLKEFMAPTAIRAFCNNCGSRLMNYSPDKESYLSVSLGVIIESSQFAPIGECYVEQKQEHTRLNCNIPHFEKLPELPAGN